MQSKETKAFIADIEALEKAASEGPWCVIRKAFPMQRAGGNTGHSLKVGIAPDNAARDVCNMLAGDRPSEANAAFIAACKPGVARLLSIIKEAEKRDGELREALTETLDVAGRHRRIALDYKFGTKVAEKLPTDREWMATQDKARNALSPSQDEQT